MPDDELLMINRTRVRMGLAPIPRATLKEHKVIALSPQAYAGLQAHARRLGYTSWRGANVSLLLEALGMNLLNVQYSEEITDA